GDTVELGRRTESHRGLLGKRDSGVARHNGVATVLDLRDGRLVAGIKNLDAAKLSIGLAGCGHQMMLAGIGLELVRVTQFADNRVLRARLIALSCKIDNVARSEERRVGKGRPTPRLWY